MGKPIIHAQSSARKFGGKAENYLPIHEFIDSSSAAFPDVRHRAITHTTWFIRMVVTRVFGTVIWNSKGKPVSVIDIAEQHVLEDYGHRFIPTVQDFLALVPMQEWMRSNKGNTAYPPSHQGIANSKKTKGKAKKEKPKIPGEILRPHPFVLEPRPRPPKIVFPEPNEDIRGVRPGKNCNLD